MHSAILCHASGMVEELGDFCFPQSAWTPFFIITCQCGPATFAAEVLASPCRLIIGQTTLKTLPPPPQFKTPRSVPTSEERRKLGEPHNNHWDIKQKIHHVTWDFSLHSWSWWVLWCGRAMIRECFRRDCLGRPPLRAWSTSERHYMYLMTIPRAFLKFTNKWE